MLGILVVLAAQVWTEEGPLLPKHAVCPYAAWKKVLVKNVGQQAVPQGGQGLDLVDSRITGCCHVAFFGSCLSCHVPKS